MLRSLFHPMLAKSFIVRLKLNLSYRSSRLFKMPSTYRSSSYPFLSGDLFRSLAHIRIESYDDFKTSIIKLRAIAKPLSSQLVIYVEASLLENKNYQDKLLEFSCEASDICPLPHPVLIIHNGDKIPPYEFLLQSTNYFDRVYAVNIVHETDRLRALPIGLENLHHNKNGQLQDFLDFRLQLISDPSRVKNKLLFSSFNVETNPIRVDIAQSLAKSRFSFNSQKLSPSYYRKQLSESYFCISPPGNGIDCHRTWESIYLGAVPVVLKGYLASSLINKLPILAVDSYQEFLGLSDQELYHAYHKTISKSIQTATARYWIDELDFYLDL